MDLEALLKNFDAFKARLDTLEAEMAAKSSELEKVTHNRDSILKEKRQLEGRDLDGMEQRIRESAMPSHVTHGELRISREEARSAQSYREAKAQAEKLGIPLRIVDENAPKRAGPRSSPVKTVKDADAGVLYVNSVLIERHGQARCREIAAEQGASTMRAFRSVDDLPDSARQAHAQAIADRSNLFGDQS